MKTENLCSGNCFCCKNSSCKSVVVHECSQNCNQGRDCDCGEYRVGIAIYLLIIAAACFLWFGASEAVVTYVFGLGMAQMPGRGDYEWSFFDNHQLDPRCTDDDSAYECDSCGRTFYIDDLVGGANGLICLNCQEIDGCEYE